MYVVFSDIYTLQILHALKRFITQNIIHILQKPIFHNFSQNTYFTFWTELQPKRISK